MTRTLVRGARSVADAAGGAARHLMWYVAYQIDGSARPGKGDGRSSAQKVRRPPSGERPDGGA